MNESICRCFSFHSIYFSHVKMNHQKMTRLHFVCIRSKVKCISITCISSVHVTFENHRKKKHKTFVYEFRFKQTDFANRLQLIINHDWMCAAQQTSTLLLSSEAILKPQNKFKSINQRLTKRVKIENNELSSVCAYVLYIYWETCVSFETHCNANRANVGQFVCE